jgi:hypothetical protein
METPKQKAKELVDKYLEIIWQADKFSYLLDSEGLHFAKQCALIAVDELIEDNKANEELVNGGLNKHYWQQVKTEIENYEKDNN